MSRQLNRIRFHDPQQFRSFFKPAVDAMRGIQKLQSKANRPLQMSFEEHLRALVFFHLEEHHSAQHLLQVLEDDDFARSEIAPKNGISKSSFSEATNTRGLEQFMHVFQNLQKQASEILPQKNPELGVLVGIDGSLIDATLSMYWADYRKRKNKAKVHIGFGLNQAFPRKVYLTHGNGAERPFVTQILSKGQTGVLWTVATRIMSVSTSGNVIKSCLCAESRIAPKKTSFRKTAFPLVASSFLMPS